MLLVTPVASGDKLALLRRARGLRSRCVCIVSISYTPVFFNTLQLRTIIAGASDSCTVKHSELRKGARREAQRLGESLRSPVDIGCPIARRTY